MTQKRTITIDDQAYDLDSLSQGAKQQLANLRVADREIARLQMQLADLSRCPKRNFMRQVTQNLTKSGAEVGLGDTSS